MSKIPLPFENPSIKTKYYRLRAECVPDVPRLIEALGPKFIACSFARRLMETPGLSPHMLPDCECLLLVDGLTLDELRKVIRRIEDGHVMLETVQSPEHYTGDRDPAL